MRAVPVSVAQREDRPTLAYALGVFAFFLFALTDSTVKFLVSSGAPVLMVVFARYAVNFLLVLALYLPKEGFSVFRSNARNLQIMRGLALLTSTSLNFLALRHLPLTTTIPIFFAMPLIVCLLSVPLLGERVGIRRYLSVAIGFVGVLLIVRPTGVVFHWAMIASVMASVTGSLYFIFTRMIAGRDGTPVSQIYGSGISTLVIAPFALSVWDMPDRTVEWLALLIVGALAGVGHIALTIGYRYMEAAKLTPLVYTELIYVTIISWVVFSELPDGWTVLGTAIIVGSGLYMWMRERSLD